MLCYYCTGHDPRVNLSVESALFSQKHPVPIVLVYRCRPVIVIGRNQNPWNEINFQYIHGRRIDFLRRETGGGAVYHDLGNINFSFILPRTAHSVERNLTIVVRALHRLGVKARHTNHSDILVAGYKVSGSAFRHKDNHVLHHGTLLCRARLRHLRGALQPEQIVKQGIMVHSRPASVTNVCRYAPVNMRRFLNAITQELGSGRYFPPPTTPFAPLNPSALTTAQRLLFDDAYRRLGAWQWRVQKTAPCRISIAHRNCYLQFRVIDGCIAEIALRCWHPQRVRAEALCTKYLSAAPIDAHLVPVIRALSASFRPLFGTRSRAHRNFMVIFRKLSTICHV